MKLFTNLMYVKRRKAFSHLLILFLLLVITPLAYAQNQKVQLTGENITLREAFIQIEQQSKLSIDYDAKTINVKKIITSLPKGTTLNEVMSQLLQGTNCNYAISGSHLIITVQPKKAQTKRISGVVSDASTGEPITGAILRIEGTSVATVSDVKGKFSLDIINTNSAVVISFLGYTSGRIPVNGQSVLEVKLVPDIKNLDEVVVVGYGTQKKATTTGAITMVRGEQLTKAPTPNLSNSLAGRFAGVNTVTSSGEPGNDGASIRIRGVCTTGNASALIVVDGIAGRQLDNIDVNDVENVTVLKDASAAIYGAQGANGVILITTKRGKIGKTKITFTLNQGATQATVLPDMANSSQYATMINEINTNYGNPVTYSPSDITKFGDGSDPWGHPNTNWYKSVIKPWSLLNSENMTISGGNEKTKFIVSLGAKYQDAIYQRSSTGYSQLNFRSNIDTKISEDINVSFDVAGRQENRNNIAPVNSTNIQMFNPAVGSGDIFEYILRGKPTMNAFWPNGQPGPDIENGMNAAVVSTDVPGYDKNIRDVFESNLKININIPWVKGLSITGNVSVDAQFESRKIWQKPWYLNVWDGITRDPATHLPVLVVSKRGPVTANLNEATQNSRTTTYNALLNYDRQFGAHSLKVLVGNERSSYLNNKLSAFRTNYQSTILDQLFAGGNESSTNYGIAIPTARVSYFGRVNYGYADKYLLEFVWRQDGSNNFYTGHQFGFFPGLSAGWRISEEKFWKDNLSFINYFKIRGSYGTTGNDRIMANQYLANYGYTPAQQGSLPAVYILGPQSQNPLLRQIVVPNINVTWETAIQRNIGFETQLVNNKLGVEFDYFKNNRSDMLLPRNGTIPGSTGITSQLPDMNMGKASSKGFEVVLSYKDKINDLAYNVSVNGSYAKSRVDYIDEVVGGDIQSYQISTGKPIPNDIKNPYYDLYYQAIGIFKDQAQIDATPHWEGAKPGDIIFKDVKADGVIDGKDMVRDEYSHIPRFTAGLSIDLRYKQFDLSLLFQGAAGAKQYYLPYSGLLGNFPKDFADNRWTPTNINASYPRAFNMSEYWYVQRNTFFLHSTDYLRIKNLVIGYTTSPNFNKLLRIESIRFYVSANNLFTLTKFKNFDPEMSNERGRNYPLQRVINGGITITF